MKKILLDQGLAPRAAELLYESGWDAIHVSAVGLERADDEEILGYAASTGGTSVTLDHDFHAHLELAHAGHPSVILLREEGLQAEGQAALITSVWEICAEAIEAGAAVSASRDSVRVRRLPLR